MIYDSVRNFRRYLGISPALDKDVFLPMKPGCFAVFFPTDAHRPLIRESAIQSGRKVVFKVKE